MNENDRKAVERLWCAVLPGPFQAEQLLRGCMDDAGYDFHGTGLTEQDLREVWDGAASDTDWHAFGFFAGEVLAFYQGLEGSLEPKHLPRWWLAVLLIKEAIGHGYSSWDLQEDKVRTVFDRWKPSLSPADRHSLEIALDGR